MTPGSGRGCCLGGSHERGLSESGMVPHAPDAQDFSCRKTLDFTAGHAKVVAVESRSSRLLWGGTGWYGWRASRRPTYACLPRLKSLRPIAIPSAQHGDQEQTDSHGHAESLRRLRDVLTADGPPDVLHRRCVMTRREAFHLEERSGGRRRMATSCRALMSCANPA